MVTRTGAVSLARPPLAPQPLPHRRPLALLRSRTGKKAFIAGVADDQVRRGGRSTLVFFCALPAALRARGAAMRAALRCARICSASMSRCMCVCLGRPSGASASSGIVKASPSRACIPGARSCGSSHSAPPGPAQQRFAATATKAPLPPQHNAGASRKNRIPPNHNERQWTPNQPSTSNRASAGRSPRRSPRRALRSPSASG